MRLLKVLNLLANFFELGFANDDALGDAGIVRFGAEGVEFTKNLLGNELQRSTNRLVPPKVMRELGEVAFHSSELLGNVRAIGKERNLFDQALVVGSNWQTCLLNSLQQSGPIFFDDFGMQSADLLDLFAHCL